MDGSNLSSPETVDWLEPLQKIWGTAKGKYRHHVHQPVSVRLSVEISAAISGQHNRCKKWTSPAAMLGLWIWAWKRLISGRTKHAETHTPAASFNRISNFRSTIRNITRTLCWTDLVTTLTWQIHWSVAVLTVLVQSLTSVDWVKAHHASDLVYW